MKDRHPGSAPGTTHQGPLGLVYSKGMDRFMGFLIASVKLSIPAGILAIFVQAIWPFGVALAIAACVAIFGDP